MKKNLTSSIVLLALVVVITSAFTVKPIDKPKEESVSSLTWINELYWYASDDVTYTGHFRNLQDEMNYLASTQPLYYFYSSPVTGSVAYEYGYTASNPSGATAQTIYRKLK